MPEPTAEFLRADGETYYIVNLPEPVICQRCGVQLNEADNEEEWVQRHRPDIETLPRRLARITRRRRN